MAKYNSDEIVLSYYDCLLRARDVALLQGSHWLNDVVIGFYFEYLDAKYNTSEKKEMYFMSPELTQLLKMTDPSEYSILLDHASVSECKCIFFPLNNCDSRDTAGGSHWSLLVYCKADKMCYHFDSSKGYNNNIASKFAKNITNFVLNKDKSNKKFVEADCPQQDNPYDCGVYVLCLTDVVAENVSKTGRVDGYDYDQAKQLTRTKRAELLHLINELKQKSSADQ
ncbi:sentrin-specific protease 8-like [Hylaeus anthracinus]|uniref:sentrin-specific protease 8-like n=1 Tax=Hylaeus volcanicus TaxID=313075 RepID=UPI0023B84E8B|nr:sentrin-specific protease 8-like [Hylaeus volcanicus]XP_053972779.1 sentrin-specific protease 8-like [Hylaeus volcanicus]XP_053972780.1 sentrin-specific protease 8-like [Hylaeus volcanicus]XP_054000772.1 sentrin-specific protease 8-like [Hylaeus anthracinus]XP_054000773.1 sentrin-specific protease 8-like [Hylaeus anthracinus]XP_054000774.1 sentrin-specific protease 8-like [Hylaeus anthracinus]